MKKFIYFFLPFFVIFYLITNSITYSQTGLGLSIQGRVISWTYPNTNNSDNTLPISDANLNGINSISIKLIGPINHPTLTSTTRNMNTGALAGQGDGWYLFSGLQPGTYGLVIQRHALRPTLYWDHAPNSSNPLNMNATGTETDTIKLELITVNLRSPNVYVKEAPYTYNVRVDSVGYYTSPNAVSIPGVTMMATSSYRNYEYSTPKIDTVFTTSSGTITVVPIGTSTTAATSNCNFSMLPGTWTFHGPRAHLPTGVGVIPLYTIEGFRRGRATSTNNSFDLNTDDSYSATLSNTALATTTTYVWRYIVDTFGIRGVIRYNDPISGTISLGGVNVKLTGPGNPKEVSTNPSGMYAFLTSLRPTIENPTNFYYNDYVITPESDVYEFFPPEYVISNKINNTQFTGNFNAILKRKIISGVCYDGYTEKSGITVYIDSLREDGVSWSTVETLVTDAEGKFSRPCYSLSTYRVRTADLTGGGLTFFPTDVIFERLIADKEQDFYTYTARHWITGKVTDITDPGNPHPREGIVIEIFGNQPDPSNNGNPYYYSTSTSPTGDYNFLVPNGDTYRIRPIVADGAVFDPSEYDNIVGNLDVTGLDFNVEFIAPVLISPADNSVLSGKEVTFTWRRVSNASSYYIEYSTSSTFNTIVGYSNRTGGATDTTFYTSLPDFNTTYYWRVNATKSGIVSPYSESWSFRSGLDVPILNTPSNQSNVLTQTPTLTWDAVVGASKYSLVLRDSSTLVINQFDNITSTYWTSTTLTEKNSYFWKVIAYNSEGVASSTSEERSFYVLKPGYRFSGTIKKASDEVLPGAIVTLASSTGTFVTVTNSLGEYEFLNVATYSNNTITVSLAGYTFAVNPALPGNSTNTANNLRSDVVINFTATPTLITISGTVYDYDETTPLAGVVVDCYNGTHSRGVITGIDGNYLFTVYSDSNYTITPSYSGRVFNPNNRVYQLPLVTLTDQDFKAEMGAFILTGYVKDFVSDVGIKDVVIEIISSDNPTMPILTLTDATGRYIFTALSGSDYTISAVKKGYTINSINGNPQNLNSVANTTTIADFTVTHVNSTISGIIYDYENHPLAGVVLELYINGSITADEIFTTTVTGEYNFYVNIDNTYRVVPTQGNMMFNPSDRIYNYPDTNYSNQDYYLLRGGAFIVEGYVYEKVNGIDEPLRDVMIIYECNNCVPPVTGFAMTSATGYYRFSSDMNAMFTIQAIKEGYTIETFGGANPVTVGPVTNNITADVLYATKDKYTLSGVVTFGSTRLQGVFLTCTGSGFVDPPNITTGSNGSYSFTVEALGNYTIIPSFAGFTFNPQNYHEQRVMASITNLNFTATIDNSPKLVSPINGTLGVETRPTFRWLGMTGITFYNLQYSTVYDFSSNVTTVSNVVGTERQIIGLSPNTTYFWRGNAVLPGSTVSAWSEIWSFRTAGGKISWNPSFINFDTLVVGRSETRTIMVMNQGEVDLIIFSTVVDGNDKAHFGVNFSSPITIPAGTTYNIDVNFAPTNAGSKTAFLYVSHNDASTQNPIEIPLSGVGILTKATLILPSLIDFGSLILGTDPAESIIEVYNSSNVQGDYLTIRNDGFDVANDLFEIVNTKQFPIILGPGMSHDIVVKFKPEKLGLSTANLSLPNTSSNNPNPKVLVRGNVSQGELLVLPSPIDFGNSTRQNPYKDTVISIQNNSSIEINIEKLEISGDVHSFIILDSNTPLILQPNETKYVTISFHPRYTGRANAVLNVYSDYTFATKVGVPLTGIGGENPVIRTTPMIIDFGVLRNTQTKDTVVIITNDGSIDLMITARNIVGQDPDIFDILDNTSLPIIIQSGESYSLNLRATGIFPVGNKTADLVLINTDPNTPNFRIQLLAQVRSSSLMKSVDRIEFDTVDVGYYQDTLIVLQNDGDENIMVTNITFDGAYNMDFLLVETPLQFEMLPGEIRVLRLRFKPNAVGFRFSRMVISTNDEAEPLQYIILSGYGRNPIADIAIGSGLNEDDILDFGAVPVLETRSKILDIFNLSKHAELMIDTMYFDYIEKQPFSYVGVQLPLIIEPKGQDTLILNFNPHDKVNEYFGVLNIVHRVPSMPASVNQTIQVKMKGSVIFPIARAIVTQVLEFGKVVLDQSKVAEFDIINRGVSYLKVDDIYIIGEDASEFTLLTNEFPIIINNENYDVAQVRVLFNPTKLGSKDAQLIICWNDLYEDGLIKIWAEGVQSADGVIDINELDEIPTEYNLSQNYPNPFNPTTKIQYSIIEASHVKLSVYNSMGQEVMQLVNENQQIGKYIIDFNSKNLPSGVYFYRLQTGKFVNTKKMMLIK